ncbi:MAG: transcriptional regulator [Phycisphaerae bacterium]|nr:transcriptional regulator [Phycisphaerae bacterium]
MEPETPHDRALESRIRLQILAALLAGGGEDFVTLRKQCRLSDGSLHFHLRILEEAGYIRRRKHVLRQQVQSRFRITPAGRAALRTYLDDMQTLLHHIKTAVSKPAT